jgi:hypothetical protein
LAIAATLEHHRRESQRLGRLSGRRATERNGALLRWKNEHGPITSQSNVHARRTVPASVHAGIAAATVSSDACAAR